MSTFLEGAVDLEDVVRRTVATAGRDHPPGGDRAVPRVERGPVAPIEVVTLSPEMAIVIVVGDAGTVYQRSIRVPEHSDDDLQFVRDAVNAAVDGEPPAGAIEALNALAEQPPPRLGSSVVASVLDMLATDEAPRVAVGGMPNLTRFGAEFETTVQAGAPRPLRNRWSCCASWARRQRIIPVTWRCASARRIPSHPLKTTSVVASSYGSFEASANLGIVGPTRMDYPSTMAAVRAVARYVGQFLAEG